MSELHYGLICTALLFGLILLRVPIAIAMIASSILGIASVQGWFAVNFQLSSISIGALEYGLSVVPLFVLMGNFAAKAGLSRALYSAAHALVGNQRGGLAMATVVGCAGFATICGSSLATAATMGEVSLNEMRKHRYDTRLAAGAVAAGSTIGILIPPSVILIIYAILTEQSVGKLFAAGILPGILLTLMFMLTLWLWTKIAPQLAPPPTKLSWQQKFKALQGIWMILALVILVIGGLYAGFFSPTEAAAIGAFGTFLLALFRGQLTWQTLQESVVSTVVTSTMIFLIVIGSELFSVFLAVTGIPHALQQGITALELSPWLLLGALFVIYLILGMFMDSLGMILLSVPVFYPLVQQAGFDPIWFGIFLVMVVELGLITPPLGLNVFIVRNTAPDIRLESIYQGVIPFFLAFLLALIILTLAPALATWLPQMLY